MSDPSIYPESQIEPGEGVQSQKTLEPDARLANAQDAYPSTVADASQGGDQADFKDMLQPQPEAQITDLDTKILEAQPASDSTDKPLPAEKGNLAEQMSDTPHYNQGNYPDCLLQSARMVEARQTGIDPGLEVYKKEAIQTGDYSSEGTHMDRVAKQIDARPGLTVEYTTNNSLEDIQKALDNKESVIVGVNAAEFYPENGLLPDNAGHAVVVTGLAKNEDGDWKITVNDPNEMQGNTSVSQKTFIEAWKTSGNPMIRISKDKDVQEP